MAVKIRLKRMGKIRQPFYRVVVVDGRAKRDGRVIEEIGKYNPKTEPSLIEVDGERAQYWLGVGAQPTEAVAAILKVTGDWQRFKGESGSEGTLKTAAPRPDKLEIFNKALAEAGSEPTGEAVTRRSSRGSSAGADNAVGGDQGGADDAAQAVEAQSPEGAGDAAASGSAQS